MPGPDQPRMPDEQIACAVCRKEIPVSAAFTPQGAEYIGFFCGMECYQEFVAEQKAEPADKPAK